MPGLLNTGADRTVLPFDYAEPLGYGVDDLELQRAQQVQGLAEMYVPRESCRARLPGADWYVFSVSPVFIGGALNALWCVHDFFKSSW